MTAQLLPSQQKIASSDIEVAHRDVLIRLRSIIGSRAGEGSLRLRYRQRRSTTRAGMSRLFWPVLRREVLVQLACGHPNPYLPPLKHGVEGIWPVLCGYDESNLLHLIQANAKFA